MRPRTVPLWLMLLALAPSAALPGCASDGKKSSVPIVSDVVEGLTSLFESTPAEEPAPKPRTTARADDPIVAGTIGELTLMADVAPVTLRGFGLVIGLNGTGSRDCPTSVRDYLVNFLNKQIAVEGRPRPKLSPGELIDSPDTAVVEISGTIPAASPKGTRFDLQVRAIAGTSTTSIAGGLLLPCEMRIFDVAAGGEGMYYGAPLAEAGGPILVNPFVDRAEPAATADARRGYVLGGGRTIEQRLLRLTLVQPNYNVARRIERRINERFGQSPKVAMAMSRGYVDVATPPGYQDRLEHFQRLLAYLYLESDPAIVQAKLAELDRSARERTSDFEPLGFAWEGIGKTAKSAIQEHYAAENELLRFYAARAGLNMDDSSALPIVAQLARGAADHAVRLLAIRELGRTPIPGAANGLVPLLSEPDQEIRIAAYEALLQQGHPAIVSSKFPFALDRAQLNLSLDVVNCGGPPLIYVRRTRLPRIVLFGKNVTLSPPVFYRDAEDALTVTTVEGSSDVQVFMMRNGRLSEPYVVPPRVSEVITALASLPISEKGERRRGMALPYSRVVQVLNEMARDGMIRAPIAMEQATFVDLLGPEALPERPEGERKDELFDPAEREPAARSAVPPDREMKEATTPAPPKDTRRDDNQ